MQHDTRAAEIERHILTTQQQIIEQARQLGEEEPTLADGRELLDKAMVYLTLAAGSCFSPFFLAQTYRNHEQIEAHLAGALGERFVMLHEADAGPGYPS
ncbi:hypothetical protein [Aquipseudomonas alcaligenes]|uniref:Uncharacterized protein n=1 Tax=Aquipseudomonas alcaligenes TaxID=43263 RepID=A0A1N6X9P0_AQUAC|nr:hypothetical protein [Pseudomonas alcaligenes]SIQ99033.1 hypothetical protein SAMN05878282_11241 [Pseudomonas alcaligenes]